MRRSCGKWTRLRGAWGWSGRDDWRMGGTVITLGEEVGMADPQALLERESRDRGKLSEGEALTPESAFVLGRDMPYRRASSRQPEAIIKEWRGTCSGRHYLLADVFRESALESQVIMCTHRFTMENTPHFPAELRDIVKKNPMPDVHTYLRVKMGGGWTAIDAT